MPSRAARRALIAIALVAIGAGAAVLAARAPLTPPPPPGAAWAPAPERPPSSLTIPVRVPLASIETAVDSAFPRVLLQRPGEEITRGLAADLIVRRAGSVSLAQAPDDPSALALRVPLAVRIDLYRVRRSGERGIGLGQGRGDLEITANAAPALTGDWALDADVALAHRWLTPPVYAIGGAEIELESLIDEPIADKLRELEPQIAARLRERVPLRERLEVVWERLGEPRPLGPRGDLWLQIAPRSLSASSPLVRDGALELQVGTVAGLELSAGAAPEPAELGPLPPRGPLEPTEDEPTRVAGSLQLDWEELAALADGALAGTRRDWTLPGGAVIASATVTEITELYPSGHAAVVGLALSVETPLWTSPAEAWLVGRPVLEGGALSIADFDYAAYLDRPLTDAILRALLESLRDQVIERLVFPLDGRLEQIRARADEGLRAGRQAGPGGRISGRVDALQIDGIRMTDPALVVDLSLTGQLALELTAPAGGD